jgi:ribosome biogenesis protein ERB1
MYWLSNLSDNGKSSYPHIGYDINGKKIMRPATGDALQSLLDSIEVPEGWTGLTDINTGNPLNLTKEELELVRRVQMGLLPEDVEDPYPDTVEWFTSVEEKMRKCDMAPARGVDADPEQLSARPRNPSVVSSPPRMRPSRS